MRKEVLSGCAALFLLVAWAGGQAQAEFEKYCRQMTGRYGDQAAKLEPIWKQVIAESYDRLDRIERIRYPDFDRTLFENAVNGYCASHHYEAFRHVYLPWWSHLARHGEALPRWKVRETWSRRLKEMRPTLERSPENWKRTMISLTKAARACFEHPLANEARITELLRTFEREKFMDFADAHGWTDKKGKK